MKRRALAILFLLSACDDVREPFRVDVVPPDDLEAAAYELNFFSRRRCEELAFAIDRPDLIRTSTPTVRRRAPTHDALGSVDLTGIPEVGALEVRAIDADGTPLAFRCVSVTAVTDQGRFILLEMAPPGARLEVLRDVALRAGSSRRDARVRVLTKLGNPVSGVFIATGLGHPLARTGDDGFAAVSTPTTTPSDQALGFEAYGVPGPRIPGRATVLRTPPCPRKLWSGALGAGSATATLLAGANDVIAVLLPRPSGDSLIELYRPSGAPGVLERVATATSAGRGPISIAEDRRDGSYLLAVGGEQARVALHRFDPTSRRMRGAGTLTATLAGALPRLSIVHVAKLDPDPVAGPSVIVAAPELDPPTQVFDARGAGFRPARPLIGGEPRVPTDLMVADLLGDASPDLALAFADALWVRAGDGLGGFSEPIVFRGLSGRIARGDLDRDRRDDLVLLARTPDGPLVHPLVRTSTTFRPLAPEALPASADRAFIDDLDGDGRPDVLALSSLLGEAAVLSGDGRGELIGGAACADLDDSAGGYALDLDRDGRREWITLIRDAREIAVLGVR